MSNREEFQDDYAPLISGATMLASAMCIVVVLGSVFYVVAPEGGRGTGRNARTSVWRSLEKNLSNKERERVWELREDAKEEDGERSLGNGKDALVSDTSALRRARAGDYEAWLKGYLQREESPIPNVARGDFPAALSFWVASEDLTLANRHGAASRMIIVEKGVNVTGRRGHSTLFFMDGHTVKGDIGPFVFGDTSFE